MAEIVNLRMVRKARARTDTAAQAAANRAAFGRTKAEKAAERTEAARRERAIDGARRDDRPEHGPIPTDPDFTAPR